LHCAQRDSPRFDRIDANAIGKSFYLLIHLNAISCTLEGGIWGKGRKEGNQVICEMQSSQNECNLLCCNRIETIERGEKVGRGLKWLNWNSRVLTLEHNLNFLTNDAIIGIILFHSWTLTMDWTHKIVYLVCILYKILHFSFNNHI